MEIHQPHEETPEPKEATGLMKYQLAQIVKRSIRASFAWEAMHVIGMAKQDTKLRAIRGRIKHKELERQHQHQSSNLQLERGAINHSKAELSPLYREHSNYHFNSVRYTSYLWSTCTHSY